ncbi:MAG: prolipoprotein diacylglyceryl transferase [Myxococcales bacterium]|nr:prolipoprotein diacylglyceryl transferase [Myxococcales bacterium]MDH5565920.1 prolipoprotein diacylglyceryl transferase [Myxococcales bacterium]
MYPELFRIGNFSVSTFGLMMAIAFLVGSWITAVRMKEEGLDPELAWSLLVYVMLGGVVGSKLYFAVDVHLRTGVPFTELLFAREGITWYGGLVGATLAGAVGASRNRVSIKQVMDCTAVAGAVGQSIGRLGCFLVGDDYGRASDLPWALAFPKGAPPTLETVHPTQIYEILWLLPVAFLLWKRRRSSPFLFGEYIALNGLGRIFIETLRVNPKVALGLTEPQFVGIALIVLGAGGWLFFRERARAASG